MSEELTLLESALKQLHTPLSAEQKKQFATYIDEINLFNPTYRLVHATGREFVIKHLLDSLAPLPHIKHIIEEFGESATLCDVGSGGGLPGIPLAIMNPSLPITLIERSTKRAGFLRNTVAMCNLSSSVTVIEEDLTQINCQFAVVTFRAVKALSDILPSLEKLLAKGGSICAYKGQIEVVQTELAAIESSRWDSTLIPIEVPLLEAERVLCVLTKRGEVDG